MKAQVTVTFDIDEAAALLDTAIDAKGIAEVMSDLAISTFTSNVGRIVPAIDAALEDRLGKLFQVDVTTIE